MSSPFVNVKMAIAEIIAKIDAIHDVVMLVAHGMIALMLATIV